MDIKINAKDHPNQIKLSEFYTQKLNNKFSSYPFITTMKVDVNKEKEQYKISLTAIPTNGNMMYANCFDRSEHIAFTKAMQKIKRQMEKYKESHYHSSTKSKNR